MSEREKARTGKSKPETGSQAAVRGGAQAGYLALLHNPQLSSLQRQQAAVQINRLHGNRYLQGLMPAPRAQAAQPSKKGWNGGAVQKAPGPRGGKARVDWDVVIADLNRVRQLSTSEVSAAHKYLSEALPVAEQTRNKLDDTADRYEEAFGQHEKIVNRAKKQAASREGLLNVFMGIGLGVAAGVVAAAALPASAGASLIVLGEFLAESAAAGMGVGAAGLTSQNVGDISVGSVNPLAMRVGYYRHLVDLYRGLAVTGRDATGQGLLLGTIGDMLTQARLHKAGVKADVPADKVVALVNKLKQVQPYISYQAGSLQQLKKDLEKRKIPSTREFEQFIWIQWISTFGHYNEEYDRYFFGNTDVLDNDTIEGYLHGDIKVLGSGSLLGVDFGDYTSEDDEREAVVAANDAWGKLLSQYQDVLKSR